MICLPILLGDAPTRTPAIYRCPAAEAESKFFERFVEEGGFDAVCIEPAPGPKARRLARGKLKFVSAKAIDTRANVLWRNSTLDFVNGKISPRAWLARTQNLHETVHFLSYPKAPNLRDATGQESGRAVFAELFVLALPGRPCFTADDTGNTRYLPGPGRLESWLLAMEDPHLVVGKPKVIRADAKPGLLVFRVGKKTFYLNNGKAPLTLPKLDLDKMGGISRGLDLEGKVPSLLPTGFLSFEP